jgi:FtsZ-interacting cell division protein ZipA
MSTLAIVLIALGALALILLVIAVVRRRAREVELDDRRAAAEAHRSEAAARHLVAEHERRTAEAHHEYADEIDPDRDSTEATGARER